MRFRKLVLCTSLFSASALLALGCEDGPEQVFSPNEGDPNAQNGLDHPPPVNNPGSQTFDVDDENTDEKGRGQFCSVQENDELLQAMVKRPIVPNESVGGVPIWTPDNRPMHADELLAGGEFCDPQVYANAYVWGPLQEIVYFFIQETRLFDYVVAETQYQGALEGDYTGPKADGTSGRGSIRITIRDRMDLDGVKLDQFRPEDEEEDADGDGAVDKPRAWVNKQPVNALYRMIRQSFFGSEPIDDAFDCIEEKLCNVIFQADKSTLLQFTDSGVVVLFAKDGVVTAVALFPVRVAPFERETTVSLGQDAAFSPKFASINEPDCQIGLLETLDFADFKDRCIGSSEGANKVLQRANFNVFGQRDGVSVEFNGATFDFVRDLNANNAQVIKDGEHPADSDSLRSFSFSRNLTAPVAEFRPRTLALAFKDKLERRIREAVDVPAVGGGDPPDSGMPAPSADAGVAMGEPDAQPPQDPDAAADVDAAVPSADAAVVVALPEAPAHPFLAYDVKIPADLLEDAADEPSLLETLTYARGPTQRDWIGDVVAKLRTSYDALTPEQQAQVDPKVLQPTWVVEPFVEAVIEAFTYGHSTDDLAVTLFRNTDDRLWSIAFAYFYLDGVPYRLNVQFNLSLDAVSYVDVSKGLSTFDEIHSAWNDRLREKPILGEKSPFYGIDLARNSANPLGLGNSGVKVLGYDRKLATLDVEIYVPVGDAGGENRKYTVKGAPRADRNGYLKQIRGRRWEFVPADVVELQGLETSTILWITEDGTIGKVAEGGFKQGVQLCADLFIKYGDDVREKVEAFVASKGAAAFQTCDLVFNYSANGNVLDEVVSLANQVSFVTINGRAVQTSIWR